MEYKYFKMTPLSRLGLGNMRLPVKNDVPGKPIDRVLAREMIDYAMKRGINYYDTACVYHDGESESFLADELIARYDRKRFNLATKYTMSENADYKAFFEKQLKTLKTHYIDFYLLHSVTDDNCDTYINNGCIEYFLDRQLHGEINYLGFSSHASPDTLRKIADHHKWDFAQIQFNYFDYVHSTSKEEYEILTERQIPIMVMEPVRGGKLANLSSAASALLKKQNSEYSEAAFALLFAKSFPNVQVTLSGMSNMAQLEENVRIFSDGSNLNEEDKEALFEAAKLFKKEIQVPCTSCRYCCADCPAKIEIPKILSVYNNYKTDGTWALQELKTVDSVGKPIDCVSCGACQKHCPQNIDVPSIMKQINELTADK